MCDQGRGESLRPVNGGASLGVHLPNDYLGSANLIVDGQRYVGRLFGTKGGTFRFVGRGYDRVFVIMSFADSDIVPESGTYPWRVELKPRAGNWQKAVITDPARNQRKED